MERFLTKFLVLSFTSTVLCSSSNAYAATDGAVDEDGSTGTSDITMTVEPLVKLTGMNDLAFSNYVGGDVDPTMNDDVCVYSNMLNGLGGNDYSVTMSGDGTEGLNSCTTGCYTVTCTSGDCMTANGGNQDQIVYRAFWTDGTGEEEVGTRGENGAIGSQSPWSNLEDCSDVSNTNANFRVLFDNADITNNKRAGTYEGTLTIVIAPTP
jgi:hypothetical protein